MFLYYSTQLHSSAPSSSSASHLREAVFRTPSSSRLSSIPSLPSIWSHRRPKCKSFSLFFLSHPPPLLCLQEDISLSHNAMQPSALLLAQRQRQMAALCSRRRAITPADTVNPTWIRKVRQDVPGKSHRGTYNTTLLLQGSQFYCC